MKNTIILLALSLMMIACKGSKKTQATGTYLTGTTWKLLKIKDMSATASRSERQLIIALPDKKGNGTINGNGGCNNFNGTYSSGKGDGTIKFSQIAATKMACENDNQEQTYFDALERTNSYVISNNILKLYNGGDLLLTFEATSTVK